MKIHKLLLPTLILTFTLAATAADNPFVGMWQPDMEATLEKARQNPKFKEEDAARMEKMLPQIIEPMRMQMTEAAFTMKFGKKRQQTAPYTVETVEDSKTTLLINPPNQENPVRATLTRTGEDQFTLQMEGNNDMNIFVWKKAESMEAEDPNMASIVAGLMGAKEKMKKEADQVPEISVEEAIQKNLRAIAQAANQYMLENGVAEVSFADLKGEYFKPLRSANGENYKDIVIKARQESISVTDKDGKTHTLKLR